MNKPGVFFTLALGWIFSLFIIISGCATTKHPPTAFERKIYLVETNEQITFKTNYVTVTNVTGAISVEQEVSHKTNEVYTLHPNPVKQAIIQDTAGGLGSLFGFGGIASTLLGGLYTIHMQARNRKVNSALIQGIETAREVLANTPQGQKADEQLVSWLKNHQREKGVINLVANLVNTTVDNEAAKEAAKAIIERTNK